MSLTDWQIYKSPIGTKKSGRQEQKVFDAIDITSSVGRRFFTCVNLTEWWNLIRRIICLNTEKDVVVFVGLYVVYVFNRILIYCDVKKAVYFLLYNVIWLSQLV